MEKPDKLSWEITTNENGVVMATLNRDRLVEVLRYVEHLEDKVKRLEPKLIAVEELKFKGSMQELDRAKELMDLGLSYSWKDLAFVGQDKTGKNICVPIRSIKELKNEFWASLIVDLKEGMRVEELNLQMCPKCHDRGWIYNDITGERTTCPCHY